MMELPEIYTFSRQIGETMTGMTVARAEANHTPHGFAWYTGDPASYDGILTGKRITGSEVAGGALRIRLQDEILQLSAPPRYHAPGKKQPPRHQLILEFTDGGSMTCSVQMWGSMYLFKARREDDAPPSSHSESPTPYDEGFTQDYFLAMFRSCPPKYSVKALLATEQRIPGLGNGCLQDILWNARMNPKRKLSTMGEEDAKVLYRSVMDTMSAMLEGGGRDTERDLYGSAGGYRTVCSSKHKDDPCPSCGGYIAREAYLGGNVYYCPVCQPVAAG